MLSVATRGSAAGAGSLGPSKSLKIYDSGLFNSGLFSDFYDRSRLHEIHKQVESMTRINMHIADGLGGSSSDLA